jgi:hypothetical protein
MDVWQTAVQQFESSLNYQEKSIFASSTPAEILDDVNNLADAQRKSSKLRRASLRIKPLLDAIDDHGKALDVLANTSSFLPPIWGGLRVLLMVSLRLDLWSTSTLNKVKCFALLTSLCRDVSPS